MGLNIWGDLENWQRVWGSIYDLTLIFNITNTLGAWEWEVYMCGEGKGRVKKAKSASATVESQ